MTGEVRRQLEQAERVLRVAAEELVMVEHCADPGPALERYGRALEARNAARRSAAESGSES